MPVDAGDAPRDVDAMTLEQDRWGGAFGREYTDRNPHSVDDLDRLYSERFGITRTRLNEEFLGDLHRGARILEVGANVGVQLRALCRLGFTHLAGIEYQAYAILRSKGLGDAPPLACGSAMALPIRDGWADLTFTSGVLIHIAPADLDTVIDEVVRTTRRFVWGLEYWAPELVEVPYRGQARLLWKGDYASLYLRRFPALRLVRERRLCRAGSDEVDVMFLLEKTGGG